MNICFTASVASLKSFESLVKLISSGIQKNPLAVASKFCILLYLIELLFIFFNFISLHNNFKKNPEIENKIISNQSIKAINIGGKNLKLELSLTPDEKSKGLSFRTSLEKDSGMLFIFDYPGKYSFWMKDMNFPIDIIWLAQSTEGDLGAARVVYIKENARPELYPETYQPGKNDGNAKYVLETTSGFVKENNLKSVLIVGIYAIIFFM